MIKRFFAVFILFFGVSAANADDFILYTLFYNTVPDGSGIPLFGFVNHARGDHSSFQMGFVNYTNGNFSGFQWGFTNIADNVYGVQWSFANIADNVSGVQWGFANIADNVSGVQFGFANVADTVSGVQFGFVNYADSFESGIPIGFVSIVRKGGYKAVEFSANEFYPMNIGFKIGVEKFYTTFSVGYNPTENSDEQFAYGAGMGSIFNINESIFINPELLGMTSFKDTGRYLTSFAVMLGYNINDMFNVTAGPGVTYVAWWDDEDDKYKDKDNRWTTGFRASVRMQF